MKYVSRVPERRRKKIRKVFHLRFSILFLLVLYFWKINLNERSFRRGNLSTFVRKRDFPNNRNFSIETK